MNTPKQIAESYIDVARGKVNTCWWKTLVLAILAGMFIAFGGVLATIASSGITGSEAALIKGAVFPVGLILVVVCGAELFTGNCLLIAPTLNRNVKVLPVLKCLGIVYLGNFIGSVLVAVLAVYSGVFSASAQQAVVSTAAAKSNMPFGEAFLRGILCNILVCLAVWASMASKNITGKVVGLYMPIFAFVVCGFEHSVANMYYLTAGLIGKGAFSVVLNGMELTVAGALFGSLLPSTLGNILGGCAIGAAYWAAYLKKQKPLSTVLTEPEKTEKDEEKDDSKDN